VHAVQQHLGQNDVQMKPVIRVRQPVENKLYRRTGLVRGGSCHHEPKSIEAMYISDRTPSIEKIRKQTPDGFPLTGGNDKNLFF
jgi:hypothetical protein